MKHVNIIFTILNILTIVSMLIHVGIAYSMKHYSAPKSVEFINAVFYIIPLIIINIVWKIISKKIGRKNASVQKKSDDFKQKASGFRRVNAVFIAINFLVVVMMVLHIFVFSRYFEYTSNKYDNVIFYIIPLMLINDAWCIIYMNKKNLWESFK